MSDRFEECFIQVRDGEPIIVSGQGVNLKRYAIVPLEDLETAESVAVFLGRVAHFRKKQK